METKKTPAKKSTFKSPAQAKKEKAEKEAALKALETTSPGPAETSGDTSEVVNVTIIKPIDKIEMKVTINPEGETTITSETHDEEPMVYKPILAVTGEELIVSPSTPGEDVSGDEDPEEIPEQSDNEVGEVLNDLKNIIGDVAPDVEVGTETASSDTEVSGNDVADETPKEKKPEKNYYNRKFGEQWGGVIYDY